MSLRQKGLRKWFDYDDGHLVPKEPGLWVKRGFVLIPPRDEGGYEYLVIRGKRIRVDILVWIWHFGSTPRYALDHLNKDKLDSSIGNLRLSRSEKR